MAKQVLTGGDGTSGQTGLQTRNIINENFTELYDAKHARQHTLVNTSDHAPVEEADKGKLLGTNRTTGNPELRFLDVNDIPSEIARQAALESHMNNTNNPHQVTWEQIGGEFTAGINPGRGLQWVQDNDITYLDFVPSEFGGLGADRSTHTAYIDFTNMATRELTSAIPLDTEVIINILEEGTVDTGMRKVPISDFLTAIGGSIVPLYRYFALGNENGANSVEVLATKPGISAVVTNGNDLTFTIPAGCRLVSAKIRFQSYTTLNVYMGTVDMLNSKIGNHWMPITQAWREDTYAQLTGITTTISSATHDKFTINGLINTGTINNIRVAF